MHTYRDAIRRSVGAYVIYPGTEQQMWTEYHELLPGLGAFALGPAATGEATGRRALSRFLDNVMDHLASQFTRHERARYWTTRAYEDVGAVPRGVGFTDFIRKPPADVSVLLGYVRDEAHLRWIRSSSRYNLRADRRSGSVQLDGDELAAEVLVLYGPGLDRPEVWLVTGPPELWTREDLNRRGYPNPRGRLYLCLPVRPIPADDVPITLKADVIRRLAAEVAAGKPVGTPAAASWSRCVAAHGGDESVSAGSDDRRSPNPASGP